MKFIISESKLFNLMSKVLDSYNFFIYDDGKKFNNYVYFMEKSDDGRALISLYKKNGLGFPANKIYVKHSLIEEMSTLFPIGEDAALSMIGMWVANKLNIVPEDVIDVSKEGHHHHRLVVGH